MRVRVCVCVYELQDLCSHFCIHNPGQAACMRAWIQ